MVVLNISKEKELWEMMLALNRYGEWGESPQDRDSVPYMTYKLVLDKSLQRTEERAWVMYLFWKKENKTEKIWK
jgi:hypothetical protein